MVRPDPVQTHAMFLLYNWNSPANSSNSRGSTMTLHRPLIIIQRYGIQRASLPPLTFTYLNQDWAEDLSVWELSKLCSLVVAIALGGSKNYWFTLPHMWHETSSDKSLNGRLIYEWWALKNMKIMSQSIYYNGTVW